MINRNLNIRLTVLFSSIFVVGSLVLFATTYLTLYNSLRAEDHRSLQVRLLGYWAQYRTGGLDQLRNGIEIDNLLVGERPFFIRLADTTNRTLFLSIPNQWQAFPFELLEEQGGPPNQSILTVQSDRYPNVLEVGTIALDESLMLQIGISHESRQGVIDFFERSFLAVLAIMVVIGVPTGGFLATRALRPLHSLNQAIQIVLTTGNLSDRLPLAGDNDRPPKDDLQRLMIHFNKMLDKVEQLVDGMKHTIDAVAHDLRTPLTRLRAVAENALQGPSDPAAYREALSDCLEESEGIIRMINSIMDLSAAEAGVLRLACARVDVAQALNEIVEVYEYVAESRGVQLRLARGVDREVSADRQPLVIDADPVRFRQMIANLIDNAVKYSAAGGAVVVSAATAADGRVEVRVRDQGSGIAATDQPRIFERLYRGDNGANVPGLGLGLAMVKAIADAHGASIAVESRLGEGSVFTIGFPATADRSGDG